MNTSSSKSKHPFRALALVALCPLSVSTAWADPSGTSSIVVTFRDLDLNSQSGAATLYHRIKAAAQRVCGYEATLVYSYRIWQNCVRPAVDAAVAKVDNPRLTAYHTSRGSPAVTAMASK